MLRADKKFVCGLAERKRTNFKRNYPLGKATFNVDLPNPNELSDGKIVQLDHYFGEIQYLLVLIDSTLKEVDNSINAKDKPLEYLTLFIS